MTDNRAAEKPKFKAILIGGPNDGETYGLYEERSQLFVVEPQSVFIDPAIKPPEFGLKPKISIYILRFISGIHTKDSSIVRTYFFDKIVQDPYDD